MTDLNRENLQLQIKTLLADTLLLQNDVGQLSPDQPLFGPDSLGLDSVDALQLVVALDKNFGLKIADPGEAREVLRSINSIVDALLQRASPGTPAAPRPN